MQQHYYRADRLDFPGAPVLNDVFQAACNFVDAADRLHFGALALSKPPIVFKVFARLERIKWGCALANFPLIQAKLMSGRGNQPFFWGDQQFTCAHAAAIELARRISFAVHSSIQPGVIVIEEAPMDSEDPAT